MTQAFPELACYGLAGLPRVTGSQLENTVGVLEAWRAVRPSGLDSLPVDPGRM